MCVIQSAMLLAMTGMHWQCERNWAEKIIGALSAGGQVGRFCKWTSDVIICIGDEWMERCVEKEKKIVSA
jgi:hypothetical protein